MAKWTRNHAMEIGGVLLALGLVITVVSWTDQFADTAPSWLDPYNSVVKRAEGDWNIVLFILGPILLIWGGFMVGEQVVYRRRFERLIDTPKKSEFMARRGELNDIAKRLPDTFRKRVNSKMSEFETRRA